MTKEELSKEAKYVLIEYGEGLPILIDFSTPNEFWVANFPDEVTEDINIDIKVCDSGIYTLLNEHKHPIVRYSGYVPKMIPNDWGDYLRLNIDKDGFVTNMKEINFDEWINNGEIIK